MTSPLSRLLMYTSLTILLACLTPKYAGHALTREAHIVDRHGNQISSIFFAVSPDPRLARDMDRSRRRDGGSCSVRGLVYRQSDQTPRLKKVSSDYCTGSYQVDEFRSCGSACSGGDEDWTYSDSSRSQFCTGYSFDNLACNTGRCREEYTCEKDGCTN